MDFDSLSRAMDLVASVSSRPATRSELISIALATIERRLVVAGIVDVEIERAIRSIKELSK